MNEVKNATESSSSSVDQVEDKISDLENRNFEMTQSEKNTEKRMKTSKESLHDLWNSTKCSNRIIGVPEEEREGGRKFI